MAAQRLYHGTRANVARGRWLTPTASLARPSVRQDGDAILLTASESLARQFARLARGRGAAKVVEVVTDEPLAGGGRRNGDTVWRVASARVARVVWVEDRAGL